MKITPEQKPVQSLFILCACLLSLAVTRSTAADGTWSSTASGTWSTGGNWAGGAVADGSGSTAYFTNDLAADVIVHLDSARTNGSLVFADGDISTPANWILDNNGTAANVLRLEGPAPGIAVGPLSAANLVNISNVIAGVNLTETGAGLLVLSGANTFSNLLINGGRVVWNNSGNAAAAGAFGAGTTNNTITLTNGATIIRSNTANNLLWCLNVKGANTLDATGAASGNLNGQFLGDGTLNMILPPGGSSLTTGGNNAWNSNVWANFRGTVVLSGGGNLRFDINNGNTLFFGSKFATFDLGTGTNTMNERGASGIATHTTFLGALKGGPGTAVSANSVAGATNTIQTGDANLDTTFSGRINNPNGSTYTALTKSGSGTLTLAGANSYSGTTLVLNGTLALDATGFISNSPAITVVAPGVFDVSAAGVWTNNLNQSLLGNGSVTGSVYLASGIISPGAGTNLGRLTFANDLTVSGTTTSTFKTGFSVTNDSILVQGNLTLDGVTTVQVAPPIGGSLIPNGTYHLVKWTGALTGDLNNLTLSYPAQVSGASLVLQTNPAAKELVLVVSGNSAGSLVWRGDGGGNAWDHSTPNWRVGASATVFSELDSALFDDTGSNNVPVSINETVTPSSVTLNNTNADYVFSGGGRITGVTGLAKNGPGKLTVLNDNDFSGTVAINGGTVQIGNGPTAGSVGTGALINNGTVIYNRDAEVTLGAALAGGGTLIQNSTNGSLVLTANSTHNGGILVQAGTLQLGDGNSVNGSVTTTITNNATLRYYYNAGATILNGLSGNGVVNFDKNPAGNNAYVFPLTATNKDFTGTINISPAVTLHANTGNGGFNLGNGTAVNVPSLGQAWLDSSATNYNQSFTIAGNGWSGDTTPALSPGLGALRVFNCTLTGPIVLASDARIGSSSSGATLLGQISGDFQLELLGTTANPDSFVMTFAPAAGPNSYRATLVTRGVIRAGNGNAFTNPVMLTAEARLWLNGNDISIASLSGGTPAGGTNCFVWNNSTTTPAVLSVGTDDTSTSFDGIFGNGSSQPLGLNKVGAGTLTLTAISTNTGAVTVSGGTLQLLSDGSFSNSALLAVSSGAFLDVNSRNDGSLNLNNGQTLKGSGTVSGNLSAAPGSILNPGDRIGTLTVSGIATLGGTLLLELNRTNAPSNCDHLTAGSIAYGGILAVTNAGPALQNGDFFQLFPAATAGFSIVNLQTNDTVNNKQYTWNNTIGSNGRITVTGVASLVNTTPTNIVITVNGSTLDLNWPADHTGWTLQVQTNNVNVGLSNNWVAVAGSKNTNHVSIPIDPNNGSVFYRLVFP